MNIKDIFEWFRLDWNALKKSNIGPSIFFITLILIVIIIVPLILYLISAIWNIPNIDNSVQKNESIRNLGLMVAALIGIPFLIWRTSVAQKQVNVSEQGQITDRINKAVEGLGAEKITKIIDETQRYKRHNNDWLRDEYGEPIPAERPDGKPIIDRITYEKTTPNLEVRIGSIFALERIAQDSPRDHIQIMETLCAYIRENAPCENLQPTENLEKRPTVRNDIQVAINVIARRTEEQINQENEQKFRLDLRDTDLSGVNFRKGNFSAAMFHNSKIEAGIFSNCSLHGTQFYYTNLNYAYFHDAELIGTNFDHSIMNEPYAPGGIGHSLRMGKIHGICLAGADIKAVNFLGVTQKTNLTFGSKDTKLDARLEFDRYKNEEINHKIEDAINAGNQNEANQLKEELYNTKFAMWSPFDTNDLATFGDYYNKFMENMKLSGFPYKNN